MRTELRLTNEPGSHVAGGKVAGQGCILRKVVGLGGRADGAVLPPRSVILSSTSASEIHKRPQSNNNARRRIGAQILGAGDWSHEVMLMCQG